MFARLAFLNPEAAAHLQQVLVICQRISARGAKRLE
jgi:hypothetical protein